MSIDLSNEINVGGKILSSGQRKSVVSAKPVKSQEGRGEMADQSRLAGQGGLLIRID